MPINIKTVPNHLPTSHSRFNLRSENSEMIEADRFVELMAKVSRSLSKGEILAALQLFKDSLVLQLTEGRSIKTIIGNFYVCASGTMDSLDESFLPNDPNNNHELRIHFRAEKAFEQSVIDNLVVVREDTVDLSRPNIRTVVPAGEGDGAAIHAKGMVEVHGLRLRFDPKQEGQGVFFISDAGAAVRSTLYPRIMPSSVIAGVPESLPAGIYAVAIRAAPNGKDVHESRLEGIVIASA